MKEKSKTHQTYNSPSVFGAVSLEGREPLLAGSIVDALNAGGVNSHAQEVADYDFSSAGFNHSWE